MKNVFVSLGILLLLSSCNEQITAQTTETIRVTPPDITGSQKIQVALLLDTSNSMDGLIEQTKSRLWNIVNTLTTLKFNGESPDIEIALYEYGNDNIPKNEDWVRLVVPLTKDLDDISEKLFALRTRGGTEYCGSVIAHAAKNLQWDSQVNSMKLVYIAGNEPFNQHGKNYKEAISEALNQDIYINTIYCGSYENGIREMWQDGAVLGKGKFFNIDSDQRVVFIATPYDDTIAKCNILLNETYLNYSISGASYKMKQQVQDAENAGISSANSVERTVSKSNNKVYDNSHWDLVDKYRADKDCFKKIKKEELPLNLRGKTEVELVAYAQVLLKKREDLQATIQALAKKRQAYIDEEKKNKGANKDDLGYAIEQSILEIGKAKGYSKP